MIICILDELHCVFFMRKENYHCTCIAKYKDSGEITYLLDKCGHLVITHEIKGQITSVLSLQT